MDIAISQHFLQPILSFFSGVIKMLVKIQMENCHLETMHPPDYSSISEIWDTGLPPCPSLD